MSKKNSLNPFVGNSGLSGAKAPNSQAQPNPNQRMGFQDVNKEVVANRSVKIKSKAQKQQESEKEKQEEYKKKFEVYADKTIAHHNEQSNAAVDAVSKFLNMAQDKTLRRNRGTIGDNVEREVRQELIEVALTLNNDENDSDNGKGSIVILSAVLRMLLLYRDRLNDAEYDIQQLKRQLEIQAKKSSESRE